MSIKCKTIIGFIFLITLSLSSCNPGLVFEPTFTTSPTITATVIPTQTDIPTPEPTPTPSLLQGQLSGLASSSDMIIDAAGLHITLPDSSRIVDIAPGDVGKEVTFNSEYNLYKIYDADGNISAEYDLGQGKEGDVDYVPATGWVDVQKVAKDLVCEKGNGIFCMSKDYQDANSVWFEFSPTGIFRYKEVIDDSTDKPLGRVLLAGAASRDRNQNPITAWTLVQVENYSNPGVNKYNAGTAAVNLITKGGKLSDALNIFGIDQWTKWMRKGSVYAFGCLEGGQAYSDYFTGQIDKSMKADVANFISSGGTINPTGDVVLVSVSVSINTLHQ